MERENRYRVYFIFRRMEPGNTSRSAEPRYPTHAPDYRIIRKKQAAADRLTPETIRKRLEYWTLALGPKFSRPERQAMNLRRF